MVEKRLQNLVSDPAQRAARAEEKRHKILRFLRSELFSTAEILGQVAGLEARQAIHKTLQRLEQEGVVTRATLEAPSGRRVTLWGITAHGQGMAFIPGQEQPEARYFEPGRVGLSVLNHTLELQKLRLALEAAGWKNFVLGDRLAKWSAGQSRVDALADHPQTGERWAWEMELSIKTQKRYQQVLADRLRAIKNGDFAGICWVSTPALRDRIRGLLLSIQAVPVGGKLVAVDPSRHHAALHFLTFDDLKKGI